MTARALCLGVIGGGAIAQGLIDCLARHGGIDEIVLLLRGGAASPRMAALAPLLDRAATRWSVVETAEALAARCPIVVEAAGHAGLRDHGAALLGAGVRLIAAATGALADPQTHDALQAAARAGGGQLILPSGAIGAIDMVAALAAGPDAPVIRYTGAKPPHAWADSGRLSAEELAALRTPFTIFEGTAREAARAFPQNANVAATVAMACGGFDAVQVRLVADPALSGNAHRIEAESPGARMSFEVAALPAPGKPGTSAVTALSIFRTLERLIAPVAV